MEQDQKTKEAQEKLNWAITNMNLKLRCEIIGSKKNFFKVQFFSADNKPLIPVEVSNQWIEGTDPKEKKVHNQLELVLSNLGRM